jgi:tRNA 2-selenouridine synthase
MTEKSGRRRPAGLATITQLREFDVIIDTRSPAEFALDHVPGAINCPALDDAQRAEIGTLYKQVSPFVAKRRGAALVALNIGRHLLESFQDKGADWRPLIYCWRGGRRSGAFVTVFRQIGWDAHQLEGGYKTYRRDVLDRLAVLPASLEMRVLSGPTGSAKSRVLERLAARGEQVLDLEALASHKGSVLGGQPGQPQPPQRWFESKLNEVLSALDPARPVFVEAESRRVGSITLPDSLIERMRASPCVRIDASVSARTEFLLRDYDYLMHDAEALIVHLERLTELRGHTTIEGWAAMARAGEWSQLVGALLEHHYDPLYRRSQQRSFVSQADAPTVSADALDAAGIDALAGQIVRLSGHGSIESASPRTAQMR